MASLFFASPPGTAGSSWNLGRPGGEIVVAQIAEPKTFNPVTAIDAPSREVLRLIMDDLLSINRETRHTEPSLAQSWTVSNDGLHYTLTLRPGLRFSDGAPFDSDDVVFSFAVYLDEKVGAPQRDLLIIGDKPIHVVKMDASRVRFDLARPYAAAERLFDGIAMLPRHQLEQAWREGRFAQVWNPGTETSGIAGMGPFRLREYRPGVHVILERNPYYWRRDQAGNRLPYLDSIRFFFVSNEEAQVLRFAAGETTILNRFSAREAPLVPKTLATDLGASLEYVFLFFNQGAAAKPWFRETAFRQAVSSAIDREAIVRLVYSGYAHPLWVHTPPGNGLWVNASVPHPPRSLERARELLAQGGFRWNAQRQLIDASGSRVEFSLMSSAGNQDRMQIATIIAEDLRALGINATIAPVEFRSLIERVLHTRQYDACILALGGGDSDPNAEMNVWLSSGPTHLWNPGQKSPATPWEAEIDDLMRRQEVTLSYPDRKRLFDRVQEIEARELPIISLVSPDLLVAARTELGNFRPSVLDPFTLWNAEYLFIRGEGRR